MLSHVLGLGWQTREGATKSRADEIRAKNAGDMKLKAVDDDVVRIDNIVKRMRRGGE